MTRLAPVNNAIVINFHLVIGEAGGRIGDNSNSIITSKEQMSSRITVQRIFNRFIDFRSTYITTDVIIKTLGLILPSSS